LLSAVQMGVAGVAGVAGAAAGEMWISWRLDWGVRAGDVRLGRLLKSGSVHTRTPASPAIKPYG
jgi:hypothetical protein